jgi:hypothetical protein
MFTAESLQPTVIEVLDLAEVEARWQIWCSLKERVHADAGPSALFCHSSPGSRRTDDERLIAVSKVTPGVQDRREVVGPSGLHLSQHPAMDVASFDSEYRVEVALDKGRNADASPIPMVAQGLDHPGCKGDVSGRRSAFSCTIHCPTVTAKS